MNIYFEYKVVYINESQDEEKILNDLAKDGWSLIVVNGNKHYFSKVVGQSVSAGWPIDSGPELG